MGGGRFYVFVERTATHPSPLTNTEFVTRWVRETVMVKARVRLSEEDIRNTCRRSSCQEGVIALP